MKTILNILLILLAVLMWGCEKELNIADFKDEFGNYQSELKIEALLDPSLPTNSVVRIIKTVVITDNNLYNGLDDDQDGLVDEYDERIAAVQDTSATVTVTHLGNGEQIEFAFQAIADSALNYKFDDDGNISAIETYSYGGYKPVSDDIQIEPYGEYQLQVYSAEFDQSITSQITVYPAVQFIDTLYTFQGSSVQFIGDDYMEIFWTSDALVSAYNVSIEELTIAGVNLPDFNRQSIILSRDNNMSAKYRNASVGTLFIPAYPAGSVLRITVHAFSPAYGQYLFSSLPLNDAQRSNLRDADDNPVMGCFGSDASQVLYLYF